MNRAIANETKQIPTRKASPATAPEPTFDETHEIGAAMISSCGGIQSGRLAVESETSAPSSQPIPSKRNATAWSNRRVTGDVRPVYSAGLVPVHRLKARDKAAASGKPTR